MFQRFAKNCLSALDATSRIFSGDVAEASQRFVNRSFATTLTDRAFGRAPTSAVRPGFSRQFASGGGPSGAQGAAGGAPSPMAPLQPRQPGQGSKITELPAWSMAPIPRTSAPQRAARLERYEDLLLQFQPGRYISDKLLQMLIRRGDKQRARRIRDAVVRTLRLRYASPQQVMVRAVARVAPLVEVKSTRLGAKSVPVPFPISPRRRIFMALKWIIEAARKKTETRRLGKSRSMEQCLVWELRQAIRRRGEPRKRRILLHKMALKARPYARMRWW